MMGSGDDLSLFEIIFGQGADGKWFWKNWCDKDSKTHGPFRTLKAAERDAVTVRTGAPHCKIADGGKMGRC